MADTDPPHDDETPEFLQTFDSLRVLLRERRLGEAADFLRSKIATQPDPMVRLDLMGDLAVVLTSNGQDTESLMVMRERVALAPDDALVWCGLARHLQIHKARGAPREQSDEQEALETIDHAVAVAERAGGTWLRQSLTYRARIALEIRRWDVVEDSIRRILAIPDGRGVPDSALEIKFLPSIPAGAVDPDLIERLRAKHAADAERRGTRQD